MRGKLFRGEFMDFLMIEEACWLPSVLNCLQDNVLFAKFETSHRPSPDILSQGFSTLLPIVAVHSAVGLRIPRLVSHCKETQAVEAIAFDQFLERLERTGEKATGTELMTFAMFPLISSCTMCVCLLWNISRVLLQMCNRSQDGPSAICWPSVPFRDFHIEYIAGRGLWL